MLIFLYLIMAYQDTYMNPAPLKVQIDFSQVELVSDCLKVLSNPDRLKILCVLVDGELNVQHIEQRTDIHQPTLSQQLTVLRNSQIVSTRREGKQIFYQFSDIRVLKIMQTLYEVYCSHDCDCYNSRYLKPT